VTFIGVFELGLQSKDAAGLPPIGEQLHGEPADHGAWTAGPRATWTIGQAAHIEDQLGNQGERRNPRNSTSPAAQASFIP